MKPTIAHSLPAALSDVRDKLKDTVACVDEILQREDLSGEARMTLVAMSLCLYCLYGDINKVIVDLEETND